MIYFWLVLTTAGCFAITTSRYVANPTPPPQDLSLHGASADVEVKLHYVIVPDGPGSWVRGAKWNEWVVSISNRGPSDVTVGRVSLIDQRGVHVGSEYTSVHQLESQNEFMARKSAEGMGMGGLALGSALIGGLTGIPVGLPFLFMPADLGETKDRDAVQAEFNRRQLPSSFELASGGSVRGSVFFSLMPQPQAIIVRYWTARGGTEGQIKIPLDKLSAPSVKTESP
jgi:hypothetical protein